MKIIKNNLWMSNNIMKVCICQEMSFKTQKLNDLGFINFSTFIFK